MTKLDEIRAAAEEWADKHEAHEGPAALWAARGGFEAGYLAALQDLREPTTAMKEAGAFADLSHSYGGDDNSFDYLSADDAGVVWQKMIDAALVEHPVTVQD